MFEEIDWEMDTEFDEEVREKFIQYFDKVLFAPGEGPLNWALRMAERSPLQTTKRPLFDRFLGLAAWLQVGSGDNDIFLPQKNVAKVLGLAGSTVSAMTHAAMKNKFLVMTRPAVPNVKAARFRFAVEKFPSLRERQ